MMPTFLLPLFGGMWMYPGMIPILHSPGVITPGQFGPIIITPRSSRYFRALTMSSAGMPSVITTASRMPASAASIVASAANGGGTKIIDTSAPVFETASETVLNTGSPCSDFVPPFPGEVPPTNFAPYAIDCAV